MFSFSCLPVLMLQREFLFGIGFCSFKMVKESMPGWERASWGFHSDDGCLFLETGHGKSFDKDTPHKVDDTVGAGIHNGDLYFTKNGKFLGKLYIC